MLPFAACSSDDDVKEDELLVPQELTDIVVKAPPFEYDRDSRVLPEITNKGFHIKWLSTDTLGILPSTGAQVPFPIKDGMTDADSNNARFTGGGWALNPSTTYATYYPYLGEDIFFERQNVPVDYTGQSQHQNDDYIHVSDYVYMAAAATTPDQGKVTFEMKHVGCIVWFEINTPEPMKFSSMTLKSDEALFVQDALLDLSQTAMNLRVAKKHKEINFDLSGVETTAGNLKANLYFMFAPTDLANKQLTAVVRDVDGYEEEIHFTGKNMLAGKAYKYSKLSFVTYTPQAAPKWSIDDKNSGYQSGMTAVVTVPASMQKFLGANDEMAAYINGQLRGVGKYIDGAFYLIVHGDIGEVGKVTFKYYNTKKQYFYEAKDVVDFNTDTIFGITDNPQQLPLQLKKE